MIKRIVMVATQGKVTRKDGRSEGYGSVWVGGSEAASVSRSAAVLHNVHDASLSLLFQKASHFISLCDGLLF